MKRPGSDGSAKDSVSVPSRLYLRWICRLQRLSRWRLRSVVVVMRTVLSDHGEFVHTREKIMFLRTAAKNLPAMREPMHWDEPIAAVEGFKSKRLTRPVMWDRWLLIFIVLRRHLSLPRWIPSPRKASFVSCNGAFRWL
jgi:hypothetical protein